MLVHHRVNPSIKFIITHLYTWVKGGTIRVKCLVQECNTMLPSRAQTQITQSGDKYTNNEAIMPQDSVINNKIKTGNND